MDLEEEEEETLTPKKAKCQKRKPNTPKTPKKETKANKALNFFNEPIFCMENGVNNSYYNCKLCKKKLCGNNMINLASHLFYKHEQVYEENIGPIDDAIEVKRLKLLQNCVSIVGLGGRPFASLCDYGFQQIINDQLEQFSKAGIPLDLKHITQPAVHTHLKESADQVRDAIKVAVNRQPLSVQLDIATRLGRSILSIDVQYIANKKHNIVNIGMIELKESHTGEHLSKLYRNCLERYAIIKQQVMSISGDNGKNVQKFIRIEQHDATINVARRLDFDTAINVNSSNERNTAVVDEEIESVLRTEEITDDDDNATIIDLFEECGIDLSDTFVHDHLLNETIAEISNEHGHELFNMTGINCAAHTLQLLVKDALKELRKETINVIDLCRRVIKALKLNSTKLIIEQARQNTSTEVVAKQPELTLKVPSLDVETRWGSSFVMVSSLAYSLINFRLFSDQFNQIV